MNALHEVPQPPHSQEAECSVIGGLLLDNPSFDHVSTEERRGFNNSVHDLIVTPNKSGNPPYSHFLRYTTPVTSKKGVIGLGLPKHTAAQSRNRRRSCGFHFSSPSFGGSDVGAQARRNSSSAVCTVVQPVRAATSIGLGVAVFKLHTLEPFMANALSIGTSAVGVAVPTLAIVNGIPTTSSNEVANYFGKQHNHVLRDIQVLLSQLPESAQSNFGFSDYTDSTGRKLPTYRLTRDGFTLLAMGFTGKKALAFKLAYIEAFNRMERELSGG